MTLPEGAAVTITLSQTELPATLRGEFAAWDRAGNDAWKLIAEWEAEEGSDPVTV